MARAQRVKAPGAFGSVVRVDRRRYVRCEGELEISGRQDLGLTSMREQVAEIYSKQVKSLAYHWTHKIPRSIATLMPFILCSATGLRAAWQAISGYSPNSKSVSNSPLASFSENSSSLASIGFT